MQQHGMGAFSMVLLAAILGAPGAGAQTLATAVQVRGVPFTATQVVTREVGATRVVTRGRMARDADGSTYVELVDPLTGVPTTAFVLDVPGHRGIVLDLEHHRYSIRPAPQVAAQAISASLVPDELERAAVQKGKVDRAEQAGGTTTVTHLGARLIHGLMSIGSRQVWPAPGRSGQVGVAREMESWYSVDLGMFVQMSEIDRDRHERVEVGLIEILRADPNRALFGVPAGFKEEGSMVTVEPGPTADGD